ncbi:hypothetical protein cyc_07046 [Cyclospora cayetanensis]|uniref:Uncharacterized protein n=1 Tax=Cyclospora cayetanensis TaxID=88456 RepID=A0A1D3CZM1_9EIME|nr:hypothetical protein cyc_07046 [Cyclospora cayetanensis]
MAAEDSPKRRIRAASTSSLGNTSWTEDTCRGGSRSSEAAVKQALWDSAGEDKRNTAYAVCSTDWLVILLEDIRANLPTAEAAFLLRNAPPGLCNV